MPKPAFIIDGFMEKLVLQHLCPDHPIRRIGCNGRDAPMATVARFIEKQLRVLDRAYYPAVILLDREERRETADDLIAALTRELNDRGFTGRFIIGMPDRMIENWIMADPDCVCRHGARPYRYSCEGEKGKSRIKQALGRKFGYHETTSGVTLFLDTNPKAIYSNSLSFRKFVDGLPMTALGCVRSVHPSLPELGRTVRHSPHFSLTQRSSFQ